MTFYILLAGLAIIAAILIVTFSVSGKPTVITNQVMINQSQETVFDFVADMRNELTWNPDVQIMELQTPEPIKAGTRFRAKWHMSGILTVEITQYNRPSQVTFVNGGPMEVTLELVLSAFDNQTQMDAKFTVTPHGFLRVIFPVVKRKLRAQERENMMNLKQALENVN